MSRATPGSDAHAPAVPATTGALDTAGGIDSDTRGARAGRRLPPAAARARWAPRRPTGPRRPQFAPSPRQALVLAATGGLLTETAFPSKSWWAMAYLGLALLAVALRGHRARWNFAVGLVFGLGLFLPHLWWANQAVGQPIGWLALSIAEAAAIGLFGAAVTWIRRAPGVTARLWLQCVSFSVLWVAVEHLRSTVPFGGFPWATLAFSQTDSPLLRLAPIGGSTLVSATVALIGAVLGTVLAAVVSRRSRTATAAAVVCVAATSLPLLLPVSTDAETGSVVVGAVQGNVPTRGAEAMSQARAVLRNHATGTRTLVDRPATGQLDLVLWPESASDIDPRTDADARAVVDAAAQAAGVPVLLGTQRFLDDTRYNDYVVWQPGTGATASYTKQHPVPFGEYIPYRDFFRQITPAVDLVGTDMTAGTDPSPISVPIQRLGRSVPLSIGICFEVAYDDLIRQSVLAGGELIVIPTNNASFGLTQESTQQLAMSRFRAAEHGRAVVQVSTVGVSALILPDGSVVDRTALFTTDQLSARLPLRTGLTLSDRIGARLAMAVDALAVLLVAGAGVDRLRRSTASRW